MAVPRDIINLRIQMEVLLREAYTSTVSGFFRNQPRYPNGMEELIQELRGAATVLDICRILVGLETIICNQINAILRETVLIEDKTLNQQKNNPVLAKIAKYDVLLSQLHVAIVRALPNNFTEIDNLNGDFACIGQVISRLSLILNEEQRFDKRLWTTKYFIALVLLKNMFYPQAQQQHPINAGMHLVSNLAGLLMNDDFIIKLEIATAVGSMQWGVLPTGDNQADAGYSTAAVTMENPLPVLTPEQIDYLNNRVNPSLEQRGLDTLTQEQFQRLAFSVIPKAGASSNLTFTMPVSRVGEDLDEVRFNKLIGGGAILIHHDKSLSYFPAQLVIMHEFSHIFSNASGLYLNKSLAEDLGISSENYPEFRKLWESLEEMRVTLLRSGSSDNELANMLGILARLPYKQLLIFLAEINTDVNLPQSSAKIEQILTRAEAELNRIRLIPEAQKTGVQRKKQADLQQACLRLTEQYNILVGQETEINALPAKKLVGELHQITDDVYTAQRYASREFTV